MDVFSSAKKTKIKTLKIPNTDIICHPKAVVANQVFNLLYKRNPSPLSAGFFHTRFLLSSVFATINNDGKTEIFAGFDIFNQAIKTSKESISIVYIENISGEEIEIAAWHDIVNLSSSSISPKDGWAKFLVLVNCHMPDSIKHYYFGRKKITVALLSKLAGLSISTLNRQLTVYKESI